MGWNRPSETRVENGGHVGQRKVLKGIVAGAIVVIGALVASVCLFRSPKAPAEPESPAAKGKRLKSVAPAVAAKPATNLAATAVKQPQPKKDEPPPYVKKPGQMQLPDGKILTFPTPKEGEIRKVYAYGHLYECDHLGNFKDVTKRKLFHTAFEANFLALAQEGKGYIPAFLTGLDEKAVRKMLEKNYTPIGDETDEEWASLKAYDEMRCAALSYMEQGGKFDDFVNEYATFDRKQREAKAVSMKEVMTRFTKGDVAGAKEMARAANLMMENNGYRPITFPKRVQEAFDALPDEN